MANTSDQSGTSFNRNILRVSRAEMKRVLHTFRRYSKPSRSMPSVLIAFAEGYVTFEIEGGESSAAHAEGEWHGKAHVPANVLAAIHAVPPAEDPVTLSYSGGKLCIGSLAVGCRWELLSAPLLRRSQQPDVIELLALERTLTRPEILGTDLGKKISQAKRVAGTAITKSANLLEPYGVTRAEIEALLEKRIAQKMRSP
jgi:hypothetical protein